MSIRKTLDDVRDKATLSTQMLDIRILPARVDNYIYLLHDAASGHTAAVDPSDAAPVEAALWQQGWNLTHIFSTHHHGDHVGGNAKLHKATGCEVIGFEGDAARIPAITRQLKDGERFDFSGCEFEVLFIPGHTLGHIAYYCAQEKMLFCGDTLFLMGCGRLFEGTPVQMFASLKKLAALPGDTRIYCGHEYTEANGRFALHVEPENPALQARMRRVKECRAAGQPTIPGTIAEEKATNPFLRAQNLEVFTALRKAKDAF